MATMIKIDRDDFGELMEHLHKVKKHFKKVCELVEESAEGSRMGSGRSGRRDDRGRFYDEDED